MNIKNLTVEFVTVFAVTLIKVCDCDVSLERQRVRGNHHSMGIGLFKDVGDRTCAALRIPSVPGGTGGAVQVSECSRK